ncbi:hypothetical protein PoB_002184100 [Plakobranchus ocellatus]|uniref:Uncharacterized protein n=1 Tax=Plakobranchus ocellatus TaxID=259542 RepID=A0AAV3ZLD3_9GAST|nr:hypothetical protein PoB_002184100 [Plakobranchus ocellatus]
MQTFSGCRMLQAAEKHHQEALTCSGYKQQLRCTPTHNTRTDAGAARAITNLKANSQSGETTHIRQQQSALAKEQRGSIHRIP